MKISEITAADVAKYLRLESGDYDNIELAAIMTAAEGYIVGYTGIPAAPVKAGGESLDDYEDIFVAYMVLCQDMYDNRAYMTEKSGVNRVVDSILGMHQRNLI